MARWTFWPLQDLKTWHSFCMYLGNITAHKQCCGTVLSHARISSVTTFSSFAAFVSCQSVRPAADCSTSRAAVPQHVTMKYGLHLPCTSTSKISFLQGHLTLANPTRQGFLLFWNWISAFLSLLDVRSLVFLPTHLNAFHNLRLVYMMPDTILWS
jgi:hypothetical protein